MRIRMIASDFDGTIGQGEQLLRDARAIERFRAKGNLFGLVSGRNAAALAYVQKHAGFGVDFLLSDNGGNCFKDGKRLFCKLAGAEVLLPLSDYMMARQTMLLAVNRPDGADMRYYRHGSGWEEYEPRRAFWKARPFTQVSGYFGSSTRCRQIAGELNALFPRLEALPNGGCLDVVPRGSGKAQGIRALAKILGVAETDVYAVGDNYNDLSMIDAFGSFVVSRAPEEVRRRATKGVVESVEEMIVRLLSEE